MIIFHNKRVFADERNHDPIQVTYTVEQALRQLIITDLHYGATVLEVGPLKIQTRLNMFGGVDINEYRGSVAEMQLLYRTTLMFVDTMKLVSAMHDTDFQLPPQHSVVITVMVNMLIAGRVINLPLQDQLSRMSVDELLNVFLQTLVQHRSLDQVLGVKG